MNEEEERNDSPRIDPGLIAYLESEKYIVSRHKELKLRLDEFTSARSPQYRRNIIRGNVENVDLPDVIEEPVQEIKREPFREYNVPLGRYVEVVELPDHEDVNPQQDGTSP